MRNCGRKSNLNRETDGKESGESGESSAGDESERGCRFIETAGGVRGREARVADALRQG